MTTDSYQQGNFFHFLEPSQVIFAFYPFVSTHPALAWGLPEDFGNASRWADSLATNMQKDGIALVVHQGKWEEEEFDQARKAYPLELVARKDVTCPFYPLPHPACASLYRLSSSAV
jgi:hypothetical protein